MAGTFDSDRSPCDSHQAPPGKTRVVPNRPRGVNPADAHRHGPSAGPPSRSRVRVHPQVPHGVIDECSAHGYYKPKSVPPVSTDLRDTMIASCRRVLAAIPETPAADMCGGAYALAWRLSAPVED